LFSFFLFIFPPPLSLLISFSNPLSLPQIEDSYRKQIVVGGIPKSKLDTALSSPAAAKRSDSSSSLFGKFKGLLSSSASPAPAPAAAKVERESSSKGKEAKEEKKPKKAVSGVRKADANVITLSLGSLKEAAVPMTGDMISCSNPKCSAALSHLSALKSDSDSDKSAKRWQCEFCGQENKIRVEPQEIPNKEISDYMVSPPAQPQKDAAADDSLVVFCIDVSGSMCVTEEVPALQAEWMRVNNMVREEQRELRERRETERGERGRVRAEERREKQIVPFSL
jgi:hypothetical protein